MAKHPHNDDKSKSKPTEVIDGKTGEVTTHTAPAASGAVVPVGNDDFAATTLPTVKVKRQITVPTLTWPENTSIIFKAVGKIHQGKELKNTRGGKANFGAAEILHIQAPNGALRAIVIGAVLKSELQDNYPNDSYEGKWFRAHKFAPNAAKEQRYATYMVEEIEDPTQPASGYAGK
jgi:hypothetical protein